MKKQILDELTRETDNFMIEWTIPYLFLKELDLRLEENDIVTVGKISEGAYAILYGDNELVMDEEIPGGEENLNKNALAIFI